MINIILTCISQFFLIIVQNTTTTGLVKCPIQHKVFIHVPVILTKTIYDGVRTIVPQKKNTHIVENVLKVFHLRNVLIWGQRVSHFFTLDCVIILEIISIAFIFNIIPAKTTRAAVRVQAHYRHALLSKCVL